MECARELRGVEGIWAAFVRALRAVSGVGALICDFFGVSVGLLRPLPSTLFDEDKCPRGELGTVLLMIFAFRPAVMNGCRKADCGFKRLSDPKPNIWRQSRRKVRRRIVKLVPMFLYLAFVDDPLS